MAPAIRLFKLQVVREIERKFLVRTLPDHLDTYACVEISQGYLAVGPQGTEVRLRKAGDICCLTVKQKRGEHREEHNLELTAEQWAALWPMTAGWRLYKRRYDIPHGEVKIEIDLFSGRNEGLVFAEVEFPTESAAEAFEPLPWFGAEITGDPRFSNRGLAVE